AVTSVSEVMKFRALQSAFPYETIVLFAASPERLTFAPLWNCALTTSALRRMLKTASDLPFSVAFVAETIPLNVAPEARLSEKYGGWIRSLTLIFDRRTALDDSISGDVTYTRDVLQAFPLHEIASVWF